MDGLRSIFVFALPPRSWLLGLACLVVASVGALSAAEPLPVVHAFVAKHCASCHNDKDKKADLSLAGYADGAAMLRGRKVWDNVLDMVGAGEMPPKNRPQPTADELASFTASVKAVIQQASANAKPDPGRVTVRRLNRFEYNNTIRDLVGVDFNAAEDFPSDDIGHGFDNIGDVLTVSPVLMERYLAAAESIAKRAIMVEIPKPASRYLSSRFFQPYDAKAEGRFRLMDVKAAEPLRSGPFASPGDYLKFSATDDLYFRANLYAETTGKSPVKVALFLSGKDLPEFSPDAEVDQLLGAALPQMKPLKILQIFEITARDAKQLQQIEVLVKKIGKVNRAGIALVKPPEGEEPAKLYIEHLWSEGPLDNRPLSHRMLLECSPDKSQPEQTREILTRFVSRAYRRPATEKEVASAARLVEQTQAEGGKWEAGLQNAIAAVLCSPKFLFRLELDDRAASPNPLPLDEYQLASRLSYFLWGSLPDTELFDLAAKKQLTAQLQPQVERMLKDERSKALYDSFALQWLQLQRLRGFSPDKELFPQYNPPLQEDMLRETRELFLNVVREDRPLTELIDCNYTFLNERLARHYGIVDTAGNLSGKKKEKPGQPIRGEPFVRVELQDGSRGGLLTMASVLTVTSNPTRTSPVKRGKWVLEQILGAPPPPPPPNVPELAEQKGGQLTGTLRERMEQHRANPACANCHAKMDPLGFAFENFDAVGRYRSEEDKFPIDPSGELPDGRKFSGPAELKGIILQNKDQFVRCLAEKLLTYALGRGLEYYDQPTIDKIVAAVAQDNYKFSRLAVEIARSDPFRLKRGQESQP